MTPPLNTTVSVIILSARGRYLLEKSSVHQVII